MKTKTKKEKTKKIFGVLRITIQKTQRQQNAEGNQHIQKEKLIQNWRYNYLD